MTLDQQRRELLDDAIVGFTGMKSQAERAIAQVDDPGFFATMDGDANSIAHLVKHMGGNAVSRWTDFLTSDGEKPDRNRDEEFIVLLYEPRTDIMDTWQNGWRVMFETLHGLEPRHFDDQVHIRGEAHSVLQAINRQTMHYSYHVGQIVFIAKHLAGSSWQSLSIPRGESNHFNEKLLARNGRPPSETESGS